MKLYNFQPKVVLSKECLVSLASLYEVPRISQQYSQFDLQVIDTEWRKLRMIDFSDSIKTIKYVDEFWMCLYNWECDGEFKLKNVAGFVLKVLSLPHSSVECERIFSKVNLIKTKVRNRFQVESLNGLLLSKHIKSTTCIHFNPTNSMINSMNVTMYNYERIKETDVMETEISNSDVEEFGNFTA